MLDQSIFAGVGNIIKNEVLFRIRLHPLSTIDALPAQKLRELIEQARVYSFDFLEWRKVFLLKKNLLAHNRKNCPRCDIPFSRAHLGRTHRRAFFCSNCPKLYGEAAQLPEVVPARVRRPAVTRRAGARAAAVR